ncbi:hypothetical protein ACQUQP_09455 [Marinobacterium sp. YM272]|uniref:hypothetical protein n=1 Tax=Marinobacterium sp. YM272 TaxID=3421654 RepID=UPI003D7F908E
MDSRTPSGNSRSVNLLFLAVGLLVLAQIVLIYYQLASLPSMLPGLLALVGLVSLLLRVRSRSASQDERIEKLQHSLITQRMTDQDTGAALPGWFGQALDTECRRAIREFTPLTLMQFTLRCTDPATLAACRVRLAKMLTDQVSRPGDLVGLSDSGDIELLLPNTNEQAERLAERCIAQAERLLSAERVEIRLAACTLQPKADLSPDKVKEHLIHQIDRVNIQPPSSYSYRAEPADVEALNSTFNL